MASKATDPAARLKKLWPALERAAKLEPGEVLTQEPMCKLLGVSRMSLRDWCNDIEGFEDSGAFRRGGNGVNYEFNPVACVLFLIRHFERQRDEKREANLRVRKMVAGDKLDGAPDDMTMRDVREATQVYLQILALEKEAGRLIDAQRSSLRYNELVLALRETLLGAPQRMDPTNTWEPEFREKFDNALADLMVLLRETGQEQAIGLSNGTDPRRPDGKGKRASKRRAAR